MEKKIRLLVPSVTTHDALEACLAENASVFCIENPLYSKLQSKLYADHGFCDYQMDIFTDKQIIIMRKIRGRNLLDEDRYELFYPPLHWDNWHS